MAPPHPGALPSPSTGSRDASPAFAAPWWPGLQGLLARDLRACVRRPADSFALLVFFVLVASLFPLAIGPEPELLRRIAPGVAWVTALLASMLSLGRLFADDLSDGTLEHLLLSPTPLALLVLGKALVHWLTSGLPLALVSPLVALQFGLSAEACAALAASLLLGTPVLSLLGAIGAALTVGLRGAAALLSLLMLPLVVPVMLFGTAVVDGAQAATDTAAAWSLMGALLALALAGAPLAGAAGLRVALDGGDSP